MDALFNQFGIVVQAGGVALLALLAALVSRSTQRSYLRYWALAWSCLAVALAALYLSLVVSRFNSAIQLLYFLGEYAFGYLLVAGCRNYAQGVRLSPGSLWLLAPAAGLAALLAWAPWDFTGRFGPQALLMSAFFTWALLRLRPLENTRRRRLGLRITMTALAVLVLLFGFHVLMVSRTEFLARPMPFFYRAYISIYDLIFEVVLGFGLVTLAMEDVNDQLERSNRELAGARDGMERLAHQDPLTEALNRHAFSSMLDEGRQRGRLSGSVALVDIDNLKPINDAYGHAAGDAAIRAVAKTIRSMLRPDDPLFRWGGDEFLLVLPGLGEPEARARLAPLLERPLGVMLTDGPEPVMVWASFGVAAVQSVDQVDAAVAAADAEMYRRKKLRKDQAETVS